MIRFEWSKFFLIVLIAFGGFTADASPQRPLDRLRAQKKAEKNRRDKMNCELAVLTVKQLEKRLITLLKEARENLSLSDYGSEKAVVLGDQIMATANHLIIKTSTENKMGLMAFLMAKKISTKNWVQTHS